jgi:hypothetical protein
LIHLLLLLATMAHGQASTDTIAVPLLDQIQISNLGKDTRSLLSGNYTQTGKPKFLNGFCFGDATCQTSASSGGAAISTFTYAAVVGDDGTNVGFTACIATVTLQFTGSGTAVAELSGSVRNDIGNGNYVQITILMDGAPSTGAVATVVQYVGISNNLALQSAAAKGIWAVTAGEHSFCYGASLNTAGTWYVEAVGTFSAWGR